MSRSMPHFAMTCIALAAAWSGAAAHGQDVKESPNAFPQFVVPGHERDMAALNELYALHYQTRRLSTLWLQWMPMSTLWVDDNGKAEGHQSATAMRAWLTSTRMDEEGYIASHQHRGLGHSEGWPFPIYSQSGGRGWVFNTDGLPYDKRFGIHCVEKTNDWTLKGVKDLGIGGKPLAWRLLVKQENPAITTPGIHVDTFVSPFVRLYFRGSNLPETFTITLHWSSEDEPAINDTRAITYQVTTNGDGWQYANIPCYRHDKWTGRLKQLRFSFEGLAPGVELHFGDIITAVDSRHNINNSNFIIACSDYVRWTGDYDFLRENIAKMRRAMQFMIDEFDVEANGCVKMSWVGHDGRTGIHRDGNGGKTLLHGRGVGNNYWDLLPFGGRDALATMYYLEAARRMAEIERAIVEMKHLDITQESAFRVPWLNEHIEEVTNKSRKLFWNEHTGRYVPAIDSGGNIHDYGYTFVSLEAIYYGLADNEQSRSIMDWITGDRIIKSDTSIGDDIYHWRFGPRSSTKRNIDYYGFMWSDPESIAFGDQVQDGGAVLGFSFHDLMARIDIEGPDNAWQRLQQITQWFREVQAAGGYRAYYADGTRGKLQGGGPPGGLGMDKEFFESILVPQVMLYGFLGVQPRMDRIIIRPKLPKDWPELKINNIAFHGGLISITATHDAIRVDVIEEPTHGRRLVGPGGKWNVQYTNEIGEFTYEPFATQGDTQISLPLICRGSTTLLLERVK